MTKTVLITGGAGGIGREFCKLFNADGYRILVFMVLPHYPHTGRQDENPNTTALMRMGKEWLLTPILMYQNYHLVHHLYPTVPFYRYGKVWKAREQYHREHSGSMIISPFQLGPDNPPGNA